VLTVVPSGAIRAVEYRTLAHAIAKDHLVFAGGIIAIPSGADGRRDGEESLPFHDRRELLPFGPIAVGAWEEH
jgi:hypothetical protein